MPRFFGKYRGKVTANQDPFHLGRVQVNVPSVFGDGRESWAMPCTPYAGKNIGFFTIPPIDTNVWVEFEGGDPDYPIWAGCFWGADELPGVARVEDPDKVQVFKTHGITLTWSNLGDNKGVTLLVEDPVVQQPLKMVFNADGIELNHVNASTTVKLTEQMIELNNRDNSKITVNSDSIQLDEGAIQVKLTVNSIELTCNPATLQLNTASGIALGVSPASMSLSASGIDMGAAATSFKTTPASMELSNGAAKIALSPLSVNINNGALEVI